MWLVSPQQSQTKGTELSPCYSSWWKYLCKWLVGPHSYRLQSQSHHHATYPGGSICECCLSVHNSHRLKAQSYLHATYLSGSISKSGLPVHDSHRLKAQSHHHATYPGGSTCESGLSVQKDTDCSTELLILVEVSVKVACRSTTATD